MTATGTFATSWQHDFTEVRCPVCRKKLCLEHHRVRAIAIRFHPTNSTQVIEAQTVIQCHRCKSPLEIRRRAA